MIEPVLYETYPAPSLDRKEILRYAGMKEETTESAALLDDCLLQSQGAFSPKVSFCRLPVEIHGSLCDFGVFSLSSEALARYFAPCKSTFLFAATLGVGIDRLILRHSKTSPAKSLFFGAIGTEGIEKVCDAFCAKREENFSLLPRFSPGYGDVSLSVQKEILSLLNGYKIGIGLSDGYLMSPTKSVTAFVGIRNQDV